MGKAEANAQAYNRRGGDEEDEKSEVVATTDTVVEKGTVVVRLLHAVIAKATMAGSWRSVGLTGWTPYYTGNLTKWRSKRDHPYLVKMEACKMTYTCKYI